MGGDRGDGAGECVQVTTAIDSAEAAAALARDLVAARLAACVQVVGPVSSTYRWRGGVESATEWLCLAKTTRRALGQLVEAVRVAHPYEEPEITAVPLVGGSPGYLAWIESESGPRP